MDICYDKPTIRARGTDQAKAILVIETHSLRGRGTQDDVFRDVTQYWSLDGTFLAEHDSFKDSLLLEKEKKREETV